ncbi:MAG TPA: DUF1501 domain-containing protein [Thermoleophilaceae bacterium]
MTDCCRDFSRSQLLRAAAARAGDGLPGIEPGMPTPAGTGLSRRSFVLRSAGLAMSVYGASKLGLGAFDEGVARAATGGQRVLVSVFVPGGWDSLSVLAPVGDPKYASYRPNLQLDGASTTPFAEDSTLHWHPSAAPLATLHSEGKVTAIPAIGYDHPDQSHFTSRHYWEVGALDPRAGNGWLGRYLDRTGDADNPLQGLSLDNHLSPALATASVPVAAVSNPGNYVLYVAGVDKPIAPPMLDAIGALGAISTSDATLRQARAVATRVDRLRTQIAPLGNGYGKPTYNSPVSYPSGDFANRLAGLAAMIAGDLPVRCVSLTAPGGYDTHANQAATLANGLTQTCDALLAFQRDIEARGVADRVLVKLWSEFGRRPRENGSGTDHGAAGSAFLIGTRVKGQMIGEFPGLSVLDAQQNLRSTSDFRALYCSLLEQWLEADAADIIPGASGFARPALLK